MLRARPEQSVGSASKCLWPSRTPSRSTQRTCPFSLPDSGAISTSTVRVAPGTNGSRSRRPTMAARNSASLGHPMPAGAVYSRRTSSALLAGALTTLGRTTAVEEATQRFHEPTDTEAVDTTLSPAATARRQPETPERGPYSLSQPADPMVLLVVLGHRSARRASRGRTSWSARQRLAVSECFLPIIATWAHFQ